jgi:hypothetical protein
MAVLPTSGLYSLSLRAEHYPPRPSLIEGEGNEALGEGITLHSTSICKAESTSESSSGRGRVGSRNR